MSIDENSPARRQAVALALRTLARRDYGEQELYEKLCQRCEEEDAAYALSEMREAGLVDDATFARRKAQSLAARGKSRYVITCDLVRLGISRGEAEDAVDELELDEKAGACEVVLKKYLDKLAAGEDQKVAAALARRGYRGADIRAALQMAKQSAGIDL